MASSTTTHQSHGTKGSRASFGGLGGSNASSHLDKARVVARRSTPDSEALASSDDELEKHHPEMSAPPVTAAKPARRSSWLMSDVQSLPQRRGSLAGASPHSPNNSHPSTPTSDSANWPGGITPGSGRSHATGSSFPWGTGIWNNDTRKEPPARLTEVLPSPTSLPPPGSAHFLGENDLMASPPIRDHTGDSTIPFAIPLQPNVKTYRSQSYSVGQLDPESNNLTPNNLPGTYFTQRGRVNNAAGLQHRPSRPSMLSELSHDGTSLGRVREADDDDEDSMSGSQQGIQLPASSAQTMESLARENAMLKQEAMTQQLENLQLRNRAVSTNSASSPFSANPTLSGGGHRIRGVVPEDSEYAIDEIEDPHDIQGYATRNVSDRRYSEYNTDPTQSLSSFAFPPNPKLEVIKKGHWQSSLGFGGAEEGTHSRRHSFADVPKRSGSISSSSDHHYQLGGGVGELGRGLGHHAELGGRHAEGNPRSSQGDNSEYALFCPRQSQIEEGLEL
ncbi:MAG: hypothetical protein M1837_005495 [Sclerophora amabilis]|nr:MAG: hypothetical protein M1837_005495 [Sclerophora amabilis]